MVCDGSCRSEQMDASFQRIQGQGKSSEVGQKSIEGRCGSEGRGVGRMKNFLKYIEDGIRQYDEATKIGKGKVPVYVEDPRPGKKARQIIGYVSKQATSIGAVKVSKDVYPGRKARAQQTVIDKERFPEGRGWEVTHT